MTKDKTITMSRELIEHLAAYASNSASAVMRARSVEARKILAAPIVESQCSEVSTQCSELLRTQAPIVEADGMGGGGGAAKHNCGRIPIINRKAMWECMASNILRPK